jgi:endonuclease G, mitochondrial
MAVLAILFTFLVCRPVQVSASDNLELGAPGSQPVVDRAGYALGYSEEHEQAAWVAYKLTSLELIGLQERTNNYRLDPQIITGSAALSDYRGSGFDHGHLAPAGDMTWDYVAMSESFFLSNMSPQAPGFNRGIWKRLESTTRNFAANCNEIYIVTGPILEPDLFTIGENCVSVPRRYYKVVLDYYPPEFKAIGFILPNKKSSVELQQTAVTINEVEGATGLDFFSYLPDSLEEFLEDSIDVLAWEFKQFSISSSSSGMMQPTQCEGITLDGRRCKRMTTNPSGYCWQHESQSGVVTPVPHTRDD